VTSAGTFFSKPEYPDREPSRPRAVNPRTGKEQSWTRASNFAASLDNPHALIKWSNRNAIMGASRRPDLGRMILSGALVDDVAKTDELISSAHAVMATDAKANEGTAAHAAITRAWQHPEAEVPEEFVPIVKAFASALREHGLTIKAAAQKVMNVAYDSIGEFDFVFEESNGDLVIGDAKSGKLEHAKRKFSVQLAMYDGAEYLVQPDNSVVPLPWALTHSHGVVVHLDLEHNTVSLYRIDLRIGRYGAGLAEQIRQWHTLDPLSPYVQPVYRSDRSNAVGPPPPMHHAQVDETAAVAKQLAEHGVDYTVHQDGSVERHNPNLPEIDLDQNMPGDPGPDEAELINQAIEAAGGAPEQSAAERFDELMKLDKAALQMLLKKTFGWTDLSHNRRWLARAVVAIEAGKEAGGELDSRQIVKYAAAKDDGPPITKDLAQVAEVLQEHVPMTVPEAAQAVAAADAERAAGPSTATLLEAIAGAHSEGAINALRQDVVERRGDQAWTDELVTAARARVLELLGAENNAVGTEERALAQIASANSQAELKEIWDRMTLGNTVPEQWTQKLTDAGLARLEEIKRATPPPPANPFA
jgi:hypothetical protein